MIKTTKFLQNNPLERLSLFGIDYKKHNLYPNLILLKYNQIESDPSNPIVQECRGIVLDKSRDWQVVAMPFRRFFNLGDSNAAKIDWNNAKVQEKLDGSLITLFFYDNKWNVATSGCPDGLNQVGDFNKTFGELFWECFAKQELKTDLLCPTYTYVWELTSPLNRVVVNYTESRITLIGVRDIVTLQELPVSQFKDTFPTVVEYPLTNLQECISAANKLNPLEHEGFVCVDSNFNRIKIKSKDYLVLHHLRNHCSVSRLAEVIRAGEYSEFAIALDTYPEIKQKFLEMVKRYEDVCKWCAVSYAQLLYTKDQKEFAMKIVNYSHKSILFSMRKTGKSPQLIIKEMNKNAYLRLMGIKENDLRFSSTSRNCCSN